MCMFCLSKLQKKFLNFLIFFLRLFDRLLSNFIGHNRYRAAYILTLIMLLCHPREVEGN